MTPIQEQKRTMAHHKKMAVHNAHKSADRLVNECGQLHGKINDHLSVDGLHSEKFKKAEHHLAYAIAMLVNVRDALK